MKEDTYKQKIQLTVNYLSGKVDDLVSKKDNYTLALVVYALELAGHAGDSSAMQKLQSLAVKKGMLCTPGCLPLL